MMLKLRDKKQYEAEGKEAGQTRSSDIQPPVESMCFVEWKHG